MAIMTFGRFRLLIEALLEAEAPVTQEGAVALLKRFPKAMKRIGLDVSKLDSLPVLGTGTRGTALDIGNGKVLKVTNDAREAEASSVLVGKDLKNIVHVDAVWKLKDSPYYCIIQEKLNPLPAEKSNQFNQALVATGLPIWIKRANGNWDEAKKLTKEYILSQVKKKFKDNLNSPQAQEFARDINEKWNMLVKHFGLRDMFNTLTELGIDFHDYHAGNMMVRNDGTLVLIDLGMSKVRSGGNIETISQAMGL